jgi:hypothetical protein
MSASVKKKVQYEGARIRKLNGEIVRPVLYNGRGVGYGKYFAASINNQLVLDPNGKPFGFHRVGQLESV